MTPKISLFARVRGVIAEHDDLPAFRAAYLALVVLGASLLNLGFFALLFAFHVLLDMHKYRGRGLSVGTTLRAVLRDNVFDGALFGIALLGSITMHHGASLVIMSGVLRYQESIIRALLIVTAKSTLLFRIVRRLQTFSQSRKLVVAEVQKPWTKLEYAALSCMIVAFAVPLSLMMLPADVSSVHSVLGDLLSPLQF